jgi:predicted alpha-1,2-mannosidase
MFQESGWMPTFPQANGDWSCMIGNHQAALIADTYFKGAQNFDVAGAYAGLRKNAFEGTALPWREGPASTLDHTYRRLGYMPALEPGREETEPQVDGWEKRQPVAVTLEHAYDDWCLMRLAKALGHDEDAKILAERAGWWRNVWRPDAGFFAPRLESGKWLEPFDPVFGGGPGARQFYTEMNAWTYLWAVPHDVSGLMAIMGGRKLFSERLDQLFDTTPGKPSRWLRRGEHPDASGQIGEFFASNEQSFNIPYYYLWTGEPWKTQRRVRQIIDAYFRPDPMGFAGDEDGGAMSAWYVFSTLGFFPTCTGNPTYAIGSPMFDRVELHLGNGKTLVINARNAGNGHGFIEQAELNGKSLTRSWLTHSELTSDGELTFTMSRSPNVNWGAGEPPPSVVTE